jgi:predicted membrane protein
MKLNPYKALAATVGIHFFIMFSLTYVGVYRFDHIYPNLNRFYMAIIMVAPMVLLMMIFMRQMYENRKLNYLLYGLSALIFIATFFAIRAQILVGNKQFLKSMIPHHSIAIKTCENADIDDQEIAELCIEIVEAQRREINQMEDILKRLEN